MIVYDLKCADGHGFEAWFGSAQDFDSQQERGLVNCPVCDSAAVEKAVMAPAVGAKGNQTARQQLRMRKLREEVEANCDYVGDRFADEARRRHAQGEAGEAERGIFGEATLQSALELIEDGIPVAPLPFRPRQTSDA